MAEQDYSVDPVYGDSSSSNSGGWFSDLLKVGTAYLNMKTVQSAESQRNDVLLNRLEEQQRQQVQQQQQAAGFAVPGWVYAGAALLAGVVVWRKFVA